MRGNPSEWEIFFADYYLLIDDGMVSRSRPTARFQNVFLWKAASLSFLFPRHPLSPGRPTTYLPADLLRLRKTGRQQFQLTGSMGEAPGPLWCGESETGSSKERKKSYVPRGRS